MQISVSPLWFLSFGAWKNNQIEWEKSVSVEIPFPVSRVHAVNVSTVPQLLLAAKTVKRVEFEEALRAKLQPI